MISNKLLRTSLLHVAMQAMCISIIFSSTDVISEELNKESSGNHEEKATVTLNDRWDDQGALVVVGWHPTEERMVFGEGEKVLDGADLYISGGTLELKGTMKIRMYAVGSTPDPIAGTPQGLGRQGPTGPGCRRRNCRRHGGEGGQGLIGKTGKPGVNGLDGGKVTLRVQEIIGDGKLIIDTSGQKGGKGQKGGIGGKGGTGGVGRNRHCGGIGRPGVSPGNGGRGGVGGPGGTGGQGGIGGDGGDILYLAALLPYIESGRIVLIAEGGDGGDGGVGGDGGPAGNGGAGGDRKPCNGGGDTGPGGSIGPVGETGQTGPEISNPGVIAETLY